MRGTASLLLMMQLFSGVRSSVQRTGPSLPERGKDCQVEFFDAKSERPREAVGEIQVWVRQNKITGGREAVYEEALPELRKQACKLGAEGVMPLHQTVSSTGEFRIFYVKAEAVRFLSKESGH